MTDFDLCVGVDYSGAQTAVSRLRSLQVYITTPGGLPEKQSSAARSNSGKSLNWSRKEVARWLIDLARSGTRYIAGIDHSFAFPLDYFERYKLSSWQSFLNDFVRRWPTHLDGVSVESVRNKMREKRGGRAPSMRVGKATELRLCDRWTSSAKSVFQFDVQGQVAKSSHAGIPWLKHIRDEVGEQIHFWPFDGWTPAQGKCVIAEVYPSVLRRRYDRDQRSVDEHDAYSVARWLAESDARGILDHYFDPPLTAHEREVANIEGWILGIG